MGECVGTIAAAVQLVDFAARVSHGIIQFCIKTHNAPKDLIELKGQVDRVSELLLHVSDIEGDLNRVGIVPAYQISTIRSVLEDAEDLVHRLGQICAQHESTVQMKLHLKMKIALYQFDQIKVVASRLRNAVENLFLTLQTSSL